MFNEIKGNNIYLVNATMGDLTVATYYADDKMLKRLDPPVGIYDKPTYFSIYTNEDILIGMCSMYNYNGAQVELGIRIWSVENWNKGYGTEAVSLLCDWAFKDIGVGTIVLKTVISNQRALRCYQKNGFHPYKIKNVDGYKMILMRKERDDTPAL